LDSAEGINAGGAFGAKLHATLAANYGRGPYGFTVQGRYIGSARLANRWVTGVDVDNNSVGAVTYLDLRASYQLTDRVQLFGAIDNVFDAAPPWIPSTSGGSTDCTLYDCTGHSFRIGVRIHD
jgi:outer membrane receptor protein involved in Fe transport